MENANLLVVAMAEQCKALIQQSTQADTDLPKALHPYHLLWMCERIKKHAGEWPSTKLHRWIGFIQCGMMANQMLDFQETKVMFDQAKNAHGSSGEDEDLIDHLDPESSFKLDIGGQG
jgi:hypothetical protein